MKKKSLADKSGETTDMEKMLTAVGKCIAHRWPFALYSMPGDTAFRFKAGSSDDEYEEDSEELAGFMVSFFNDSSSPATIDGSLSIEDILDSDDTAPDGPEADVHPIGESTPRLLHKAQVMSIVNELKRRGLRNWGKVVLSRVIAMESDRNPVTVAMEYFAGFPNAFRAIFYHPSTGIWITATPEILVEYNYGNGSLCTMALAGTRPAGSEEEWDKKNLLEQKIVADEIMATCYSEDIAIDVSPLYTRNAGNVEHLCQDITGHTPLSNERLLEFVNHLSPTPAVAGYPHRAAVELIERFETHFRHCYSGWLGVEEDERLRLFVNLRCAIVEPREVKDEATGEVSRSYLYNVYVGGGILAGSDPDLEWRETALKGLPLCRAIDPDYEPDLEIEYV